MGLDKKNKDDEENDPWALIEPPSHGKAWKEQSIAEKLLTVILVLVKICLLLAFLYLFVCSLDFLSNAFRLLGGKTAGESFRRNEVLNNPVGNLMMGVLATVLLQSSSTTTSIVVSMVAAEILAIRPAIFIVMGANIGTSVTNTLVALTQSTDRDSFRRAFAGATVHDFFNWLTVLILLPIEWITGAWGDWEGCGFLCQITAAITDNINSGNEETEEELLKKITKPFTQEVIQVDKGKIKAIAKGEDNVGTLVKQCYEMKDNFSVGTINGSCVLLNEPYETKVKCGFLFESLSDDHSDSIVGTVLLIFAVGILCVCLISIVKLLHSMLRGAVARVIKKFLNSDFPGPARHLTGYVAILIGAGMTMLVQSSSIFTSAVTPLVGVGVLHIERMYPLTLGANIGTTLTAILAALASDVSRLQDTMQIALCHLFFNIIGICIWYPAPFMRKVPIACAKLMGNTTANYRWFAVTYIIFVFFLIPAAVFALSVAGWYVCLAVVAPLLILGAIVIVINQLQKRKPEVLCPTCRTWDFLPIWLRSLAPYDRILTGCCIKSKYRDDQSTKEEEDDSDATMETDIVLTSIETHPSGANNHETILAGQYSISTSGLEHI